VAAAILGTVPALAALYLAWAVLPGAEPRVRADLAACAELVATGGPCKSLDEAWSVLARQ